MVVERPRLSAAHTATSIKHIPLGTPSDSNLEKPQHAVAYLFQVPPVCDSIHSMSTKYHRVSDSSDSLDDVSEPLIAPVGKLDFEDVAVPRRRAVFTYLRTAIFCTALVSVVVVVAASLRVTRQPGLSPSLPPAPPACSKIMVRHFESFTGLGSEYGVYLRAAALSSIMGWTVVPDAKNWIYGDLTNFFVPINFDCPLPTDVLDSASYHEFGVKGWENATRLRLTRGFNELLKLDALVREKQIDTSQAGAFVQKAKLWALDANHLTLPYGESVPRGEEPAFLAQAETLDRQWIPNARMQAQIARLVARLGLDEMDKTKRRPVLALQIRLGDKRTEQGDIERSGSHMNDDLSVYLQAARLAHARLYDRTLTPNPWTARKDGDPRPLLVVWTAESGVVEKLTALDVKREFDIILTPSAEFTPAQLEEYQRVFNSTGTPTLARRWEQKELSSASLDLRLAITRQLIAELYVYSRHTDAAIVSGNSNLGRMALLLGGAVGALGYPNHSAVGGRIRSIDVPFYPTTWFLSPFDHW
ncbi:hypothetical protein AURDEDRAFT_165467 [Auricularia subglabra TFB-10046 SS5]|nr:hypothetical protein AURDEDRAFT_165467 [Auricularia subglabra TFB-10046 SS5]